MRLKDMWEIYYREKLTYMEYMSMIYTQLMKPDLELLRGVIWRRVKFYIGVEK